MQGGTGGRGLPALQGNGGNLGLVSHGISKWTGQWARQTLFKSETSWDRVRMGELQDMKTWETCESRGVLSTIWVNRTAEINQKVGTEPIRRMKQKSHWNGKVGNFIFLFSWWNQKHRAVESALLSYWGHPLRINSLLTPLLSNRDST